jgi:hypothetical protein
VAVTAGPFEAATLSGIMRDLDRRGFTEHFRVDPRGLRALDGGETFAPDEVVIAERYRFEGVSDPGDMAILYAIETRNGVRGTLTDAFGVYADPGVGAFMGDVVASSEERAG